MHTSLDLNHFRKKKKKSSKIAKRKSPRTDPSRFIRDREQTRRAISPLCCARVSAEAVVSQFDSTTATQNALDVVASISIRKSYSMSRERRQNNRRGREELYPKSPDRRKYSEVFFFFLRNKTTNKELWRLSSSKKKKSCGECRSLARWREEGTVSSEQ